MRPKVRTYIPSNGSEGIMFTTAFCDRCKYGQSGLETKPDLEDCDIYLDSMVGNQPREWVYYQGNPVCLCFEEKKHKGRPHEDYE
jgi:hypothetical protein